MTNKDFQYIFPNGKWNSPAYNMLSKHMYADEKRKEPVVLFQEML